MSRKCSQRPSGSDTGQRWQMPTVHQTLWSNVQVATGCRLHFGDVSMAEEGTNKRRK